MKKNKKASFAFLAALSIVVYSCGPNDSKGGMDQDNSNKEGAVDSTRIPNFDSTHASDSSHASLSAHDIFKGKNEFRTNRIKSDFLKKGSKILSFESGI